MNDKVSAPWHKFYKNVRPYLDYPQISIYSMIEKTAKEHPDYTAYNYFGKTVSYHTFMNQVDLCAKAFINCGISEDNIVTICMPNTPEAVICFYALNKIGAISSMIHPLSSEKEIQYYLDISESKMLITIDFTLKKINNIINFLKIDKIISVSVKDSMPFLTALGYAVTKGRKVEKFKSVKTISWNAFLKKGETHSGEVFCCRKASDRAVFLYSGGTTGKPKGIVLSNLNFNALAMQGIEACQCLRPKDTILAAMPVFHGFGLGICIHTCLYYGITPILIPQFNGRKFHQLLKIYKPNIIAGVPAVYEALLRNKNMDNMDLSFIRCAISGGDSLSVGLKHKIDDFFHSHHGDIQVREGYGLTECVTGSCLMPLDLYRDNSVGLPYPDTYYKIVKPDTCEEIPYGEDGEIVLKSPTIMIEYLKDKCETASVLRTHHDGAIWLHTGDLGYMDSDGFIYYRQRIKRMIVSAGYNIYPQAIENIIDSHPDVLMSTVIGISHKYKKEVPKAFIVLKNSHYDAKQIKTEIMELCRLNIAEYALPYEIEIRPSLPKTLVGKIAYNTLAEDENGVVYE